MADSQRIRSTADMTAPIFTCRISFAYRVHTGTVSAAPRPYQISHVFTVFSPFLVKRMFGEQFVDFNIKSLIRSTGLCCVIRPFIVVGSIYPSSGLTSSGRHSSLGDDHVVEHRQYMFVTTLDN